VHCQTTRTHITATACKGQLPSTHIAMWITASLYFACSIHSLISWRSVVANTHRLAYRSNSLSWPKNDRQYYWSPTTSASAGSSRPTTPFFVPTPPFFFRFGTEEEVGGTGGKEGTVEGRTEEEESTERSVPPSPPSTCMGTGWRPSQCESHFAL
jgi:hypothetical protein